MSVALVIFQAVRAAKSQDELASAVAQVQGALSQSRAELQQAQQKLSEAQSSLADSQRQLIDLTTGGEAYPGVEMSKYATGDSKVDELVFGIDNRDETHSLYSVSVSIFRQILAPNGVYMTGLLDGCSFGPPFSEIVPRAHVRVCSVPFWNYSDRFIATINERNGSFDATFSWNANNEIVHTIKRHGSSENLEQQ